MGCIFISHPYQEGCLKKQIASAQTDWQDLEKKLQSYERG